MLRTVFLVDGFNLYHSLVDAQRDSGGRTTKWLDLRALCTSYLSHVRNVAGERAELGRIYYFSAVPTHLPADTQARHALYMRCLRASGVVVELARFKRKDLRCPRCGVEIQRHEEKETDVAMAARLFEACLADQGDVFVLLTGDTDLAPVVLTCRRLFPQKHFLFLFPYRRVNRELADLAPASTSVKLRSVLRHQFPDPVVLPDGTALAKPPEW